MPDTSYDLVVNRAPDLGGYHAAIRAAQLGHLVSSVTWIGRAVYGGLVLRLKNPMAVSPLRAGRCGVLKRRGCGSRQSPSSRHARAGFS